MKWLISPHFNRLASRKMLFQQRTQSAGVMYLFLNHDCSTQTNGPDLLALGNFKSRQLENRLEIIRLKHLHHHAPVITGIFVRSTRAGYLDSRSAVGSGEYV